MVVPWSSLKRAAHSWYTGAGIVAPAPLIAPPALAVPPPELELLLDPPELGLLSSLPQAAAPSASTTQQLRASRVFDLTRVPHIRVWRCRGEPARTGIRSRHGCG